MRSGEFWDRERCGNLLSLVFLAEGATSPGGEVKTRSPAATRSKNAVAGNQSASRPCLLESVVEGSKEIRTAPAESGNPETAPSAAPACASRAAFPAAPPRLPACQRYPQKLPVAPHLPSSGSSSCGSFLQKASLAGPAQPLSFRRVNRPVNQKSTLVNVR
jgi:hypothetical protein